MITTKRQIRTNDDRYISSDDDVRMNTAFPVEDIRLNRSEEGKDAFDDRAGFADIVMPTEPVREMHEAYNFSSVRAAEDKPVIESKNAVEKPIYSTRETIKTDIPPRPVKEKQPHDIEDVMPSFKTLTAADRRVDAVAAEKTDKTVAERSAVRSASRTNLSPKMKVVLIVCLAVALVLAIAVIATGVSISHMTAESAALSQEIAAKQSVIAEQQATLANLTNDSTLRDEAILHGMVSAGEPEYTASRAEKSDYPEAQPHTNGFDDFCDWLGGIIN